MQKRGCERKEKTQETELHQGTPTGRNKLTTLSQLQPLRYVPDPCNSLKGDLYHVADTFPQTSVSSAFHMTDFSGAIAWQAAWHWVQCTTRGTAVKIVSDDSSTRWQSATVSQIYVNAFHLADAMLSALHGSAAREHVQQEEEDGNGTNITVPSTMQAAAVIS